MIEYVAGYFGEPPAPIDPNIFDKISSLPKTKKLMQESLPQPSVKEIRKKMSMSPQVSDEEFLLRYALSEKEVNAMLAAGRK